MALVLIPSVSHRAVLELTASYCRVCAVYDACLSMVQAWADAFRSSPALTGVVSVYEDLRRKGLEFPMTELDGYSPIHTPNRVYLQTMTGENACISSLTNTEYNFLPNLSKAVLTPYSLTLFSNSIGPCALPTRLCLITGLLSLYLLHPHPPGLSPYHHSLLHPNRASRDPSPSHLIRWLECSRHTGASEMAWLLF